MMMCLGIVKRNGLFPKPLTRSFYYAILPPENVSEHSSSQSEVFLAVRIQDHFWSIRIALVFLLYGGNRYIYVCNNTYLGLVKFHCVTTCFIEAPMTKW